MLKGIAVKLIHIYQKYIRIILPGSCRFSPTCSDYTKQAIKKYGFWEGVLKAVPRILKCHPFSCAGGDDPLK